jgi:hypothetical protein
MSTTRGWADVFARRTFSRTLLLFSPAMRPKDCMVSSNRRLKAYFVRWNQIRFVFSSPFERGTNPLLGIVKLPFRCTHISRDCVRLAEPSLLPNVIWIGLRQRYRRCVLRNIQKSEYETRIRVMACSANLSQRLYLNLLILGVCPRCYDGVWERLSEYLRGFRHCRGRREQGRGRLGAKVAGPMGEPGMFEGSALWDYSQRQGRERESESESSSSIIPSGMADPVPAA